MRLLLDTPILIWAAEQSDRLPRAAAMLLNDERNMLQFSSVSIAEVAIKNALGRSAFPYGAAELREGLLANGYDELALTGDHAVALAALPTIHKDPFDRLLIAQATAEGMRLVSGDRNVIRYGGVVLAV